MPTRMSCCCLVLGTTLMSATSSMGSSCRGIYRKIWDFGREGTRSTYKGRHAAWRLGGPLRARPSVPPATGRPKQMRAPSPSKQKPAKLRSAHQANRNSSRGAPQPAPTWLMVGCTQPVRMACSVAMASMPAAAPRQCPIMLLVAFILMPLTSEKTWLAEAEREGRRAGGQEGQRHQKRGPRRGTIAQCCAPLPSSSCSAPRTSWRPLPSRIVLGP